VKDAKRADETLGERRRIKSICIMDGMALPLQDENNKSIAKIAILSATLAKARTLIVTATGATSAKLVEEIDRVLKETMNAS
jgi:hypothetical protein